MTIGGHSTKCLASTPQKSRSHQKQEKCKKLSQPGQALGDKMTKCNRYPG